MRWFVALRGGVAMGGCVGMTERVSMRGCALLGEGVLH